MCSVIAGVVQMLAPDDEMLLDACVPKWERRGRREETAGAR